MDEADFVVRLPLVQGFEGGGEGLGLGCGTATAQQTEEEKVDALHGWLCRIAYRTALNYLRRPVLQTLTMDDEAVSAAAEAEMPTS